MKAARIVARDAVLRWHAALVPRSGGMRETMADFVYDVVRHRGCWRVLHIGRHSRAHPDQEAAIRAAIKLAKAKLAAGRDAEVRLNRTDGDIVIVPLEEDAANSAPEAPPAA